MAETHFNFNELPISIYFIVAGALVRHFLYMLVIWSQHLCLSHVIDGGFGNNSVPTEQESVIKANFLAPANCKPACTCMHDLSNNYSLKMCDSNECHYGCVEQ